MADASRCYFESALPSGEYRAWLVERSRHAVRWSPVPDCNSGAREARVSHLVLHASSEGRPLYEALGFVATNEMRYTGEL